MRASQVFRTDYSCNTVQVRTLPRTGGEVDQAFEWLDRAFLQKDIVVAYIKGEPLLKSLERDPRYKTFLRKMNLPE